MDPLESAQRTDGRTGYLRQAQVELCHSVSSDCPLLRTSTFHIHLRSAAGLPGCRQRFQASVVELRVA
jgi:hypothetical protein